MARPAYRLGFWFLCILLLLFPLGVQASSPVSLIISNVRDTSFTVSWLTATKESGQVQVVGGRTFNDERGALYSGTLHYVTISGMLPTTLHQFDLVSGGTRYNNDGAHYAVMTGATQPPPTPDLILGRVQEPGGAKTGEAIVFFTVQQEAAVSSPLSMLISPVTMGTFTST